MEKITIGILFTLAIGVLVTTALLPSIGEGTNELMNRVTVTNESIDISSLRNETDGGINEWDNVSIAAFPTRWKINDCPIESFVLRNVSGATLTAGTDYQFLASTGNLSLINTTDAFQEWDNTTYADYTHCLDGYSTSSAARGVTKLITIIAALAVVAFAIGMGIRRFYGT